MAVKNNSGMTLIEVMIAFIVFALIVGPLYATYSYSARMDRRALLHTLSTYTAQMKMEEAYGMLVVDLMDDYNQPQTRFDEASGIDMLYYEYSAKKYYPPGFDPDDTTDPYIDDKVAYYDSLGLYEVTIKIGDFGSNYGVEVELTDVFVGRLYDPLFEI